MSEIAVEKTVVFLDEQKLWSIRLRTVEPYGRNHPKHIYVSAIFHKKLHKATEMAWARFNKDKAYYDNYDKFCDSMKTEVVTIPA